MSACFIFTDCPAEGILPSLVTASAPYLKYLINIATISDVSNLARPSDEALRIMNIIDNKGAAELKSYIENADSIKPILEAISELQALFIEYCDPISENHYTYDSSPLHYSKTFNYLINYHDSRFTERLLENKIKNEVLEFFFKSLSYGRVNLKLLDLKIPLNYEYELASDYYTSVFTLEEISKIRPEMSKVLNFFDRNSTEYGFILSCLEAFNYSISNNRGLIGSNCI